MGAPGRVAAVKRKSAGAAPKFRLAVDARVLGRRGVGRYLANLLRALADSREEFEARLYLAESSVLEAAPADPRFSVERLGTVHPAWAEQWAIPRRARAWGADVLHFPDNSGPLRAGLPVVLTMHDTMWRRPLAEAIARPTGRQKIQDAYRKFVCPRAARAAAAVVTVSGHSAADIAATVGVSPERLRTIHEGVDPVFTRRLAPASVKALLKGLGVPGPYVLASGAADRRKNIDRLIRAYARARVRNRRLAGSVLVVTSLRRGEVATTTYAATAANEGVTEHVRFLPYVSDEQMKALYQGALCYAFPSLWEGFGLPVLEAFSMGCPVLASNTTCLPEVAGEGAVYADPLDVDSLADGLVQASAAAARGALVKKAAARLKGFSWAEAARLHAETFRFAAFGPGRPPR
jgi:glycosyltransferase involved in cell wall biosynthesis